MRCSPCLCVLLATSFNYWAAEASPGEGAAAPSSLLQQRSSIASVQGLARERSIPLAALSAVQRHVKARQRFVRARTLAGASSKVISSRLHDKAVKATGPKPISNSTEFLGSDSSWMGRFTSLSESGYAAVVKTRVPSAIRVFVQRLVQQKGLKIADEKLFQDMVKYYDGTCGTQPFQTLLAEVSASGLRRNADCHDDWAVQGRGVNKLAAALARKAKEGGSLANKYQRGARHSLLEISAHSSMEAQHSESERVEEEDDGQMGLGQTASLDEEGYQLVVKSQQPRHMASFVRRVIKAQGMVVSDVAGLKTFLPYHGGACGQQSYAKLVSELYWASESTAECGGGWVLSAENAA